MDPNNLLKEIFLCALKVHLGYSEVFCLFVFCYFKVKKNKEKDEKWIVARKEKEKKNMKKILGSTEIWTRIAGFKVQSANHYTIEPQLVCWIHFLGQDYQLSVRLLSRALSLSKLFGTHLLIIRKTKKNLLVSCRVRTGDLVRVKHTW